MTMPKCSPGKAAHIFPKLQARESGRGKGRKHRRKTTERKTSSKERLLEKQQQTFQAPAQPLADVK